MAEENIISVTNNENPPINLEIVSYKNEVGVSYIQGKGDKGDTGEKGEKGEKGDKGDLGVSTMLVSSFTGAIDGSNATFVLNDNYDDVIAFINGIKYGSADYTYTKSTKTVVFEFAIPTGYALEFYGITNKNAELVPLEDLAEVASSGSYNDLLNKPSIPTKTSDLTNDSNFAVDANYIHTDNNFTNALKSNYDTAYTNNHTHSNSTALNNVSGINTGDQDLSGLVTKTTTINGHSLSSNITVTATDTGAPTISSGTTAPSSIPAKIGDIYLNTTAKKYYRANGTSSNNDWILLNGSYTMPFGVGASTNPSAGSSYYCGAIWSSNQMNTAAVAFLWIPRAGTITSIYGRMGQTGNGSTETSCLYIRINNTTDYLITNTITNNTANIFSNTSLNISVNAGDSVIIKWTTPSSWSTTPSGVTLFGNFGINL